MSDNDGILLEDIDHKLDAILEGQQAMAHVPKQIDEIDSRLRDVETDVKAIKATVTDQSRQHNKLDKRVTRLEQAAN